jgi:hypothetical protein
MSVSLASAVFNRSSYNKNHGKEPNSLEEQAQLGGENGYKAALLATLKRTRELLADGTR